MEQIQNVGNFLSNILQRIDGFDYKWTSLITSQPLLFEDIDYFRIQKFVDNRITQEELEAYRTGKLREVYATFETMLMCNLEHFDRIISFCTIIFYKYVRLSNGDTVDKYLKDVVSFIEMTPTQIWCCAMTGIASTDWELNYAWSSNKRKPIIRIKPTNDKSWLEANYKVLYSKSKLFQKFVEYCSYRTGIDGFMKCFISDKTNNTKLSQICSKFTRTSTAIDTGQLEGIKSLIAEDKKILNTLSEPLTKSLQKMYITDKEYALYVFGDEFYIFSKKFKMCIRKEYDSTNKQPYISKQYLSNSYECFIAEGLLTNSIKAQITWAKYEMPNQLAYEKNLLSGLLLNMLNEDFKSVKCIRLMYQEGVYSEITFSGVFRNLYVIEKMYYENTLVYEHRKCMSKENASKYIVERGYYIFGSYTDMNQIITESNVIPSSLIEHYSKYTVSLLTYMSDIIDIHKKSNNEIIEVYMNRYYPEDKLSQVTKFTTLHSTLKPSRLLTIGNNNSEQKKQTYFQAIK